MRNTIKFFVLGFLLFAVTGLSAQQKAKFGHIASDKLIQAMPETAVAQETLKKKQDAAIQEMTNLQEEYQTLINEYASKQNTYTDITRTSKEQQIQSMRERIQRFNETVQQELAKTRDDLMQPIIDKAQKAIQQVGKEKGFIYIFDTAPGVIIYMGEGSEDILPLVKAKLNLK